MHWIQVPIAPFTLVYLYIYSQEPLYYGAFVETFLLSYTFNAGIGVPTGIFVWRGGNRQTNRYSSDEMMCSRTKQGDGTDTVYGSGGSMWCDVVIGIGDETIVDLGSATSRIPRYDGIDTKTFTTNGTVDKGRDPVESSHSSFKDGELKSDDRVSLIQPPRQRQCATPLFDPDPPEGNIVEDPNGFPIRGELDCMMKNIVFASKMIHCHLVILGEDFKDPSFDEGNSKSLLLPRRRGFHSSKMNASWHVP